MITYKRIANEIVMSNEMANLAGEIPPDPIIHQNPYTSSSIGYSNSGSGGYSNSGENFTNSPSYNSSFASVSPSYSAKASWSLLRRAVNTRIVKGMKNGTSKALTEEYHLEALDPKHRFADFLQAMHWEFKKLTDENTASKLSLFFIWLDEVSRLSPDAIRAKLGGGPNTENFIRAGVSYLNGIQRKSYLLSVKGGRFIQNGTIFSTKEHQTAHSGKGWAIFVASPEGDFYAGSHVVSQFHHSSFLAGRPVLSAGEMIVENGYLKLITAKSGHYKPDNLQFYNGIKALHRNMLWLGNAKVRLYRNGVQHDIPALEYIYAYPTYSSYKVWD